MERFNRNRWLYWLVLLSPLGACETLPSERTDTAPKLDEPAVTNRYASSQRDCDGEVLPVCEDGWAGAGCDHPCSPGFDSCWIERYCHADGRVQGVAGAGTRLFEVPSPEPSPDEVLTQLEAWISGHELELGLAEGLTPEALGLEVLDEPHGRHGRLALYRFYQYHGEGDSRALVVGDGSIITVEVGPQGATAIKGTIVDPRKPFAHQMNPAPIELARAAIVDHVADRTGVDASSVTVEDLGLVAVPGADVIAWQGVAYTGGQVPVATVLVEAEPQSNDGVLPLLAFERHAANGLSSPVGVQVRTEDLGTDIVTAPISEATVSSLLDGSGLQGSIEELSGWPQLASEEVVALDVLGHQLGEIKEETDFSRYVDAGGDFDASQPNATFDAQRHYHITQEAYALVDSLAAGSWDSAVSLFEDFVVDPTDPSHKVGIPKTSDYGPGQFRPRIIDANGHAPLGGPSGEASYALVDKKEPLAELYQVPAPGLQSEVISFIKLPPGSAHAHVLMHELGHAFDVFLGPGFARTYAPHCQLGCDSTCDEDTSDESLPLTETVAHMLAMWQLQRIGGIAHDDCDVIDLMMTGAGQGSTLVHHPACMGPGDEISMFLRDDDPACVDVAFCDKPTDNETDPSQGGAHLCDATAGYNVTSLMQAWWNLLHWQYCEPTFPFPCDAMPPVVWPVGCDAPGSGTACATSDELAALPFLYALRTNPLTYEELLDEMAAFVACNYGTEAYTWFNQALCDHQLRGCGEPPPMICESCGNGIREGLEQCDGLDMGGPGLGEVATCEGEGFESGVLMCDPMTCTYDYGLCVGEGPSTTDGGLDSGGTGGSTSGHDTETSVGGVGDPGGCSCRTGGGGGGSFSWLLGAMLLLLRRPRRRWSSSAVTLGAGGLAALGSLPGCAGPSVVPIRDDAEASDEESTSGGLDSGDSEGTGGQTVFPEESLGPYYLESGYPVGGSGAYLFGHFENIELRRDALVVTRLWCNGTVEVETYDVTFEGDQAYVHPKKGETAVIWNGVPVAEALVFRPGDSCAELRAELVEPLSPYGEPGETWTWRRGGVYISTFYGEGDDLECGADWSPDVPTTCE